MYNFISHFCDSDTLLLADVVFSVSSSYWYAVIVFSMFQCLGILCFCLGLSIRNWIFVNEVKNIMNSFIIMGLSSICVSFYEKICTFCLWTSLVIYHYDSSGIIRPTALLWLFSHLQILNYLFCVVFALIHWKLFFHCPK